MRCLRRKYSYRQKLPFYATASWMCMKMLWYLNIFRFTKSIFWTLNYFVCRLWLAASPLWQRDLWQCFLEDMIFYLSYQTERLGDIFRFSVLFLSFSIFLFYVGKQKFTNNCFHKILRLQEVSVEENFQAATADGDGCRKFSEHLCSLCHHPPPHHPFTWVFLSF